MQRNWCGSIWMQTRQRPFDKEVWTTWTSASLHRCWITPNGIITSNVYQKLKTLYHYQWFISDISFRVVLNFFAFCFLLGRVPMTTFSPPFTVVLIGKLPYLVLFGRLKFYKILLDGRLGRPGSGWSACTRSRRLPSWPASRPHWP